MTAGTRHAVRVSCSFLRSPRGELCVTRWLPADGTATASVLFVPPFAEEMNKCRRMLALTARRLAEQGIQALTVDLFGTGDSAGEFRDARLEYWREDLALVAEQAACDGAPLGGLVGMRFGALLALEFAAGLPGSLPLVVWQPVASGQIMLTQFLRLRVASGLLGGAATESVASLSAEIRAGQTLEIAGYELSPRLVAALEGLDLRRLTPAAGTPLAWFEVANRPHPELSRFAAERLAEWASARVAADGMALQGDAFWTTVEVTGCAPLVDRTVEFFANRIGGGAA